MSFPEKFPFTAWAVALAAAFQAAESSTSFKAACVWSLVILAAAAETVLLFLRPVDWKKWRKWTAGLSVMVVVFLLVVWIVALPSYRKEFLTEDLRVNFGVPHLTEIGTDTLELNYTILNKSSNSIAIEELELVQIETVDLSNNPSRNSQLCKPIALPTSGRAFTEMWRHPGRKVLHFSTDKPSLPASEKTFGYNGEPVFDDDGKLDVSTYTPKTLLLEGGKDTTRGQFSIDAGKAISLTASFDTDPAAWDKHNVVVVCGAINYLGSDGHPMWAVCPATILAHLYESGKPAGAISGASISPPYTIITAPNEGLCGVVGRGVVVR